MEKQLFTDTDLGKDFAHMIILPIALKAASQQHRSKFREISVQLYERLRILKNSLRQLIIGNIDETSPHYRKKLQSKILTEKLILNTVSGRRSDILKNIEEIMRSEDINFVERHPSPISPEEKYIIKCDFNGCSHSSKNLSSFYKNILTKPTDNAQIYRPQEYKLDNIPDWKICKQFKRFKNNSEILKTALAKQQIPPHLIHKLNAYDIVQLFHAYYQKHKIYPPETSKSIFIKYFIKHHEYQFRAYLNKSKPIIIEALKNKGIIIDEKHPANNYQNFIENSIQLMKRRGTVPPLFNIHHKLPVKDTKDPNKLSNINAPQNLCLILEIPYHTMMHLFDSNIHGNTIFNRKVKRVELPEDLIFFGGFREDACIYHNYSLNYQKQLQKLITKITHKQR